MTVQTVFPFRIEADLEDYMQAHLSLPGTDLLVIGRQLMTGREAETAGWPIDLLAIDSSGVIYIIELKLKEAAESITGQLLRYVHSFKRLHREKLIRTVADGRLKIDLMKAFQRHFGHALPEAVNKSQVLVVIAASIDPRAAEGIVELLDLGCSVSAFRWVYQSCGVGLIPCCRSDQDLAEGTHLKTRPSPVPPRIIAAPGRSTIRVHVDGNTRRFWLRHAHAFASVVTFRFVYECYEVWVAAQRDEGVRRRHQGLFARDLSAIVSESEEWTSVFVAPCSDLAVDDTITTPASVRTRRAQGYSQRAYQRSPSPGPQNLPTVTGMPRPIVDSGLR